MKFRTQLLNPLRLLPLVTPGTKDQLHPSKPAPSPNPIKSLALSAARLTGSDLALVVGPVEPGPDGFGAMQIALASHNNQWVASMIHSPRPCFETHEKT